MTFDEHLGYVVYVTLNIFGKEMFIYIYGIYCIVLGEHFRSIGN